MTEIPHKHRLYGQKEFSPFIGRFTLIGSNLTDLKSCNLFTDEIGHFFLKIVCLWYTSIIHFR